MIHIKINDTIVDIIGKIEEQKSGDIILDFPLGHPILHNYISLKILKSKSSNRKLIIATKDRLGKKIGKKLGIEYSLVKDSSFIEDTSTHKLLQHNFTFWEYFKFQIRSYIQELRSSLNTNKELNTLSKYSRIYQEKSSLHFFIFALIGALSLFLFIYYFTVNKSYIYISPESIIKKESHNFIFKENIKNNILGNNKYIKIEDISLEARAKESYASTEIKIPDGGLSKGRILIYNNYTEGITFIPHTRVTSSSGIIFEIPHTIRIPAAVKDNFGKISPGSIETTVIAQIKDISGNYVGSRGNIDKETPLSFPGLGIDDQKNIYAFSVDSFTGGSDDFKKVISQKDIEKAQSLFHEKLKNIALKKIKDRLYIENEKNNSQIDILSGGKSIRYSKPEIHLEDNAKVGDIRENFSLSGSITIQAYIYNKESIIQKLKTIINEKSLEGVEKISHIDVSSLRMSDLIYTIEKPFEMKATYEIEVLFFHDFLHRDNTYTDYLSSKIRGISKEKAEKILLNDPTISDVKIENRPFFSKNISNIQQNIIFKIQ